MKRFLILVIGLAMIAAGIPEAIPARATGILTWQDCISPQQLINAGDYHTVAVREDGTVVAVGLNQPEFWKPAQCEVGGWTDVIAVSAGYRKTIGLRRDGTVLYAGVRTYGQGDVEGWKDIVAVSAGGNHSVGLKRDGTVLACGFNEGGQCSVGEWRDIVAISAGEGFTLGLRADGTVVATGWIDRGRLDVGGWTGIRAVSAGATYSAGLREDGTAVAAGINIYGDPMPLEDWRDLAALASCANYVLGLGRDGAVIGADARWVNLIAVDRDANGNHSVGLRRDGTAFADGNNDYGQCDVSGWQNLMTVPRGPDFADGPWQAEPGAERRPAAASQPAEGLMQGASAEFLYGTWKGTYTLTGSENLDKAGLSEDAADRYRAILGKPIFFQLMFSETGVEVTAQTAQSDVQRVGTLPAVKLENGLFSLSLQDSGGTVRLEGGLYQKDGTTTIHGRYWLISGSPEGVAVTLSFDFIVLREP